MAAYATRAAVYRRLKQLPQTTANDTLVDEALLHEAAKIDTKIGHGWGTATAGTVVVYGTGTAFLPLPPFTTLAATGAVAAPSGTTAPAYTIGTGGLFAVSSTGYRSAWPYDGLWIPGVPYTITGTFGWGPAPYDIVEANIELAIRVIRGGDAGYSDVVGVEGGGAVGYNGAFPASVKDTLDTYQRQARSVGVA